MAPEESRPPPSISRGEEAVGIHAEGAALDGLGVSGTELIDAGDTGFEGGEDEAFILPLFANYVCS